MDFASLLDAQVYAVQRVIQRKPLDIQLASATDPSQISSLKNQIRQIQWELTQANNYIISHDTLPLAYDNTIFTVSGLVKTSWYNEADIIGTQKYSINQSTPVTQAQLVQTNTELIANTNTLIYETSSLLNDSKNALAAAYALPDDNINRQNNIDSAQENIRVLSQQLQQLLTNYNMLTGQDYTLPSESQNVKTDVFSSGIRASIQDILSRKIGYVAQFGDVDATISMRRQALDAFYTAKNDTDRYAAIDRLQKIAASLAPSVPVTRKELTINDLFLDYIINDIGALNVELAPKQVAWDTSLAELNAAKASGNQILINEKQQIYNAAEADYGVTFKKISLAYDSLLGRHTSFGASMAFPGSNNINGYTPAPNPAYYGQTPFKLVYDTKTKQFVDPSTTSGDQGRYVSTTFTDQPPNDKQTDAQRMQSILSQQYLQTSKAAAEYDYQKTTQDLIYQNNNRTQINNETQKQLDQVQSEFNARKADAKNPITDKEFLQYQTNIQELSSSINTNKQIISDNNQSINEAKTKLVMDSNPTVSWNAQQSAATTNANASISVATTVTDPITQGQQTVAKFYDAQSERDIAQKQYNSSESIRDAAQKRLDLVISINPNDPSIPALKDDLNNKNSLLANSKTKLETATNTEFKAASDAKALVNAIPDSNPNKQAILEQYGVNPNDLNRALLITNASSAEAANIRQSMITNLTPQYQSQIDAERTKLMSDKSAAESTSLNLISKNNGKPVSEWSPADQQAYAQAQSALSATNAKLNINSQRNASSEATNSVDKQINEATSSSIKFSNTGFEGINNGAPFYMQFPTLNSITDFKLKNGIDPYGNKSPNEIARDAVVFKIFETTPGIDSAVQVQLDNGGKYIKNVPSTTNVNTLGSFTVYPAHEDGRGDWLSQTHNHHYGTDSGGIVSLANSVLDGVGQIENILSLTNGGLDAVAAGSLKGNAPAGNAYNRRVERLDYYQSTDPQAIPIRFNLFTRNNFLNDVYRPIMFLTALGYPKRAMQGDFGEISGDIIKKTTQMLRSHDQNELAQYALKGLEALGDPNKLANTINDLEQRLSSFGGIGPFRYFVSKRPEYLSVRHVSGLFYFPVAVITNFKYTFKGPWYNYDGSPLSDTKDLDNLISTQIKQLVPPPDQTFKEKVNQIFTDTSQNLRDTFRPPPKAPPKPQKPLSTINGTPGGLLQLSNADLSFIQAKGLPFAYPSWAECEITIKSAVPLFRDDFMALYYASQSGDGKNLVTVTQQATNQQNFASGGRKTSQNQSDQAWQTKQGK